MNLKPAFVVLALSLPLAGCGNKGPLILPQNPPPAEADAIPSVRAPPMDDVPVPVDDVPEDVVPPVSPAQDAAVPPPPVSGNGNG